MQFVMSFDPSPHVRDAARRCEADVFARAYGNTEAEWLLEYGPYEDSSVFLAITEPGGEAVAALRFILPSPAGLKTLDDLSRPPWGIDGERSARAAGLRLADTWDVATIAVRPGAHKPGLLAAALYHGLFRVALANDVRWIVMMMDERARRLLSLLSLTTNVLPSARPGPYLGSGKTYPLWMDIPRAVDRQRQVAPEAYSNVTLGGGIDGIAVPAPAQFALSPEHAREVRPFVTRWLETAVSA